MEKLMMQLIGILSLVIIISGCTEVFEEVGVQTARVILKRPRAIFTRNVGGTVVAEPLTTGKRNHGNGPTMAYDFDTSVQSSKVDVEVKMADNINQPVTLNLSWKIKIETVVDLALNYMPADKLPELESSNGVQLVAVPVEEIYSRNIQCYFDMAARDVIDGYKSRDVRPAELPGEIMAKLLELLKAAEHPRIIIGSDGRPTLDESAMINITDVIDLQAVSIPGYKNPPALQNSINAIQNKRSELAEKKEELKQQVLQAEIKKARALMDKSISENLRDELAANPRMLVLQILEVLERVAETKEGNNTKVMLIPESMMNMVRLNVDTSESVETPAPLPPPPAK